MERKGKNLNVFSLAMINVIAVDSLRTLPLGAVYGFSLVFFYAVMALCFFVPSILVTAELATGWPNTGGAYIWIREAFGHRFGFFAIWLQWVYNVVWYPTIFSFMAILLAYLIDPALASNKLYTFCTTLILFGCATLVNLKGIQVSSWVSIIGATLGTLLPMGLIIGLGIAWVVNKGNAVQFFSWKSFFPNLEHFKNISFFGTILFGLMGMEMSAAHAGDVCNPKKDYPKALVISGVLILLTLVLSSLAIAVVVPPHQLNLVSGLMDAFELFLKTYQLEKLGPVVAVCMLLGSLSCSSAWILGPARCLSLASRETHAPQLLQRTTKNGMPIGLLVVQGVMFLLLTSLFLFMPTIASSYWILSDLTAQLALLFYILLFASAIKLRYKKPNVERSYQIPLGKVGIWLVCGLALVTCSGSIILGFIPPAHIAVGQIWFYELFLFLGLFLFCLPPFLLFKRR